MEGEEEEDSAMATEAELLLLCFVGLLLAAAFALEMLHPPVSETGSRASIKTPTTKFIP